MGTESKIFRAIVPLAVAALVLAGCASKPGPQPDGGGKYPRSAVNTTYLDGQLRLAAVTPPATGGEAATFVLENTTDQVLEDVPVSIRFYRDAADGAQEFDVELQDTSVNVFPGRPATITATPAEEGEVKGWELRIDPLVTVADPMTGTEYLDGALRCVAMEKDLAAASPSLRFELKNVSSEPVEPPEFRVVFRRAGKVVGGTDWASSSDVIQPGGTTTIVPDLSKVSGDLGGATAVLQLQRFIL
jgi:hypothetical protein